MRGPPALNPPAQPRRPRQGYGRRRGNGGAGPGWCRTLRVSDDDAYISLTIFLVYAHLNSQVYYFVNRNSAKSRLLRVIGRGFIRFPTTYVIFFIYL